MEDRSVERARDKADQRKEYLGLLYGLLGVLGFSLTLPATKIAVSYFSPTVVGLGRALVAAVFAMVLLLMRREKLPKPGEMKSLGIVALGVIIGFPLLSAWAMGRVPASHGAIVLALLPLATAGAAALFAGEKPSFVFWLSSIAGCVAVVFYAYEEGFGSFQPADLALAGAVLSAAVGYAEGGKLARKLGGWQVICWALMLAFPILLWPVAMDLSWGMLGAPLGVWLSFGYVSIVSQFIAFIAWYHGLALGGIAKVSQLQYLQPFLTLLGSSLLVGEDITMSTIVIALIVLLAVAAGRKTPFKP
jgi:drug/metabolite transporter (DMT)-like permease